MRRMRHANKPMFFFPSRGKRRSRETRQWEYLDAKGLRVDPKTFPKRPDGARPPGANEYTPWFQQVSHLHGKNGADGIHFYGTLADARQKLRRAQAGKQVDLRWDKPR